MQYILIVISYTDYRGTVLTCTRHNEKGRGK